MANSGAYIDVHSFMTEAQAIALARIVIRLHEDDFDRLSTGGNETQDMREACEALKRGLRKAGFRPRS